jgi:phosphatidate cytidylyltransferase
VTDAVTAGLPVPSRRLHGRRLASALLFIPLLYVIIRHMPPVAFFTLVAVASVLAVREFYTLYFDTSERSAEALLGMSLTAALLSSFQWPAGLPLGLVLFLSIAAVMGLRLLTRRSAGDGLNETAVLVFGVLYVGLTMGHLLLTRALPDGVFLIFFVALVTWAGDTGAYYAGITFGHTKLAPAVSPNKTVEGLIGGCLLAVAAAVAARYSFLPIFTAAEAACLGVVLTLAGLAGDLSESMLKRSAGVKDSGSLIPGHGGILDRIDSLLFTAPTYYYYMTLVKG